MNPIKIIIVEPQMPENVGSIARCMKNFSLHNLVVVKPRFSWPDERLYPLAAGADDVLNNAQVYDCFQDALADLTYLYACSARRRYMNKEYVLSSDLNKNCQQQIIKGHNVGILFGSEANGLSNQHVNLCDAILTIDNNTEFSSMNIAQAVCIVAYELFDIRTRDDLTNIQDLCSKQDLEFFIQDLVASLDTTGFFQVASKKDHMVQNIKNIYTRIDKLSVSEVKTLRGILVALKRANQHLPAC